MKRVLTGFAIALLLTGTVCGQHQGSEWLSDAERSRFERLRESGCEALYNLDYPSARAQFSELVRLFPQHPAGPQNLASTLLSETLYKSRRLHASLYNSNSFYSKSEDKADPNVVAQFRNLTRQAQSLAEARLKQQPKDAEALYYLGNISALKAAFEESVERRHLAALRDGSAAVATHRRVLELDPTHIDAQLTIALYDYVVGSLPLSVKLLAGVFGARGSKKRGLETLERVAKEGLSAGDQARTLLVVLYMREKRYGEAAEQARQLSAKYPRNYLYRLEAADALISQATMAGRTNDAPAGADAACEAFAVYEELLHDERVASTVARQKDLIHFKYGEALLKAGRTERAAAEFLAAANAERADEGLATMAHLYAAQALDASNKRAEAMVQYRLVLSRPNAFDSHDEAHKGLGNITGR